MNRSPTYFEFYAVGNHIRISAIDERTGLEVQAIAPAGTSEDAMKRLGFAKLEKRLADIAAEKKHAEQAAAKGRGILV